MIAKEALAFPLLQVHRNGLKLKEVSLQGDCLLGRAEECDLRLDDRAISRRHALFRVTADGVEVENQSDFAPLQVNGLEVRHQRITEADIIQMGPYLLRLTRGMAKPSTTAAMPEPQELQPPQSENTEAFAAVPSPEVAAGSQETALLPSIEAELPVENVTEAPHLSEMSLNGVVSISQSADQTRTEMEGTDGLKVLLVFKLGQANFQEFELRSVETWIGRSPDCQVILTDPKVSRKHAVIRRKGHTFSLQDQGTPNGVFINGRPVQEQSLLSGDRIRIADTEFEFRALDPSYAQKVSDFITPVALQSDSTPVVEMAHAHATSLPSSPSPAAPASGAVVAQEALPLDSPFRFDAVPSTVSVGAGHPTASAGPGVVVAAQELGLLGQLKARYYSLPPMKRLAYGLFALALFALVYLDDEPVKRKRRDPAAKPPVQGEVAKTWESLGAETQAFVEKQYQLGLTFFKNRDYDNALVELQKIFALINDYKNAREIERYAQEGKRMLQSLEEERKRKQEEQELKDRVQEKMNEIGRKMARKDYLGATPLLSEVLTLDPENQQALAWQQEIDDAANQKEIELQKKEEMKRIQHEAELLIAEAERQDAAGDPYAAIETLDQVFQTGTNHAGTLARARALQARIRNRLKISVRPVIEKARSLEASGKIAAAYAEWEKVLELDPRQEEAPEEMKRLKGILHERAKTLYTEGILAEGYSDFSEAKGKFEQVLAATPKDDIYHQRAINKLKRYSLLKAIPAGENVGTEAGAAVEASVPVVPAPADPNAPASIEQAIPDLDKR